MSISIPLKPEIAISGDYDMRVQERLHLSTPDAGIFSEKLPRGLETSGFILQPTKDQQEIVAILQQSRNSTAHVLWLLPSTQTQLSETYIRQLNMLSHALSTPSALLAKTQEAFTTTLNALTQVPEIAFAHVMPTPGNNVNVVLALSPNTICIATNTDVRNGDTRSTIIQPEDLTPIHNSHIRTGIRTIPRGAKLILASDPPEYREKHSGKTLAATYETASALLQAAKGNTQEVLGNIPMDPITAEHILTAFPKAAYTDAFQQTVQMGDDIGLATLLSRTDIATLIKQHHGNFIIPKAFACIASRVPKKKNT